MWHVSSRSGVATLRTAIHFLLTYLMLLLASVEYFHRRPIMSFYRVTAVAEYMHDAAVLFISGCQPAFKLLARARLVCGAGSMYRPNGRAYGESVRLSARTFIGRPTAANRQM